MKKNILVAVMLASAFLSPFEGFAQADNKLLSDIVKGNFIARSTPPFKSMNDGEHYTVMEDGNSKIVKYSYRTGNVVETIFDAAEARECPFKKFEGYEFSADEDRILIYTDAEKNYRRSFKANYYVFDRRRNFVYTVSEGGKQQDAKLSPDGRMVCFSRNNNLHLFKLDFGTESEMTKDGEKGKIINGTPDWLYEEEFDCPSLIAWAPDNSAIAFLRIDESKVPTYDMQLFGGSNPALEAYQTYPGFQSFKYPKAGMDNPDVTVHLYSVASKKVSKMNVPLEEGGYIPRLFFTENPEQLVVMTLNRIQSVFNMYYTNPRSGLSKLITRDESAYYINVDNLNQIRFYKNSIITVSEKDGFRHLYELGRSGALVKQLTVGQWDVSEFLGYDEATNTFFYSAGEESPTQRAVYAVDAKGKKTKITSKEGVNNVRFSKNYKYYINAYSNYNTPTEVVLSDRAGRALRTLEDNRAIKELQVQYKLPKKEPFFVPNANDEDLNGWIIKPSDFSSSKKYPVVMVQYSGPGSQSVIDRWGYGWEEYMATKGFVVVCVDGRGTAGRGEKFQKSNYMALGGAETDDQVKAAQYIAKQSFADPKRIGIWGWSYGGYNVLMAMSNGNGVFAAGTAIAPVTDWRYYDTAYTERFMRTPQENFEGYNKASALMNAHKLQGKLLLVHGTADDNVHVQNTLEYADALVEAGKQFDMQLYTNRNHSIREGNARMHLFTLITEFFKKNL